MPTPQAIGDQLEIRACLYRYARAIDTREFERLSSVFTADALIHYDLAGGVKLRLAEMVDWLRKSLRIFAATQHVITNPEVELDGDRARSTCYLTGTHVQETLAGGDSLVVEGGIYHDEHVRADAGWRIKRRTLRRIYTSGRYLGPDAVRLFEKPRGR
ncbi:MAG: nuclear transport factor 2 family protein [Deltaproteobacteria bacterium]|nr:MAG: nuclear transport factor 2 family protein [Deltaproteobacteria bacterium]